MLALDKIEIIKKYLIEKVNPYLIILFGSSAGNKMRVDSDIDLAFLSEDPVTEYDLFMLSQNLAGVVGKDIDLIDLGKASSVFKVQVLGKGITIYNSDEYKSSLFKMRALKDYAILNEERQHILDKIKERGIFYE